jgi:PAS domain S-box-containing protein
VCKILFIDDDKLDQLAFERLVESEHLLYDYTIAGSVSQAREILSSNKFDIVISDYSLGDGTAFDILETVKKTPVIVVTGTGNEEIAVNAWKAGAYDYLTKDLERSYLKAVPIAVENALRHKKAEERLRLLSGAIMSTNDSVFITNMDDKIIFVNNAFCKTYGYRKEDILGKDSSILWIGKQQSAKTRSVFRTQTIGGAWQIGFYHKRKDGSIFPASLSRSIIKDSNGDKVAVVGTARDITERVLVENELAKANLELKQDSYTKCQLGIMVLRAIQKQLPERDTVFEQIKEEKKQDPISKVRNVISDFIDILEIETGQMKLELSELSICPIVSEAVVTLSPLAVQKGIELTISIPDSEPTVMADRDRIKQALTNVINYSIEAANTNDHIVVRVKDTGNEISIEVESNSAGVSDAVEAEDKLFDCFEWTKEQFLQRKEQQLSLTMPLTKKLVQMHGGQIWITNGETQVYRFCFSLPKPGVRDSVPVGTALQDAKDARGFG